MKVGTKSVLFGSHCFFIHPLFVAWAWWRLYGFPWDPRLWVAFIVHDLGYWGMPNMDGKEGEMHPWLGARWMSWWFDGKIPLRPCGFLWKHFGIHGNRLNGTEYPEKNSGWLGKWGQFSLLHSRFLAKRYGEKPSRLCIADKLAIVLTPTWLYLPMAIASGEIHEYRSQAANMNVTTHKEWHKGIKTYMLKWVEEHKDGREDTWTPKVRGDKGAWK